jgi:hypothetical protein
MFKDFSNSARVRTVAIVSLAGFFCVTGAVTASATYVTNVAPAKNASVGSFTCAEGGKCLIGDTGPGGGRVFYILDAATKSAWHYLEVAPDAWNSGKADPGSVWCSNTENFVKVLDAVATPVRSETSSLIGAGARNSKMMLASCATGAANLASAYNGGGKYDWYLPSTEELNQLYKNRNALGIFASGSYWSSTEGATNYGKSQAFNTGFVSFTMKKSCARVRPIRAF